jgi:tRNA threonylcarbamoyladenosine biosynthesis protein TsaE
MLGSSAVICGADGWDAQAAHWLGEAGPVRAWFIDGDLGAGKTTLVQAFCRALGVTEAVSSPTFSLVHTYHSPAGPVHHLDLYRLQDMDEAFDAGLLDYIDGPDYCFVEWAGRLPDLRPESYYHIHLTTQADGCRHALLDRHDAIV